ncbi:MAG: hypothetical protein PHR19_01040 [Bacteroidales bacterium]|jgi:hypothetical protein|nr:hypothetical protein [Bacteroidales bacterium]
MEQQKQMQQQQEQPQYIDPQNPFEPQSKPRKPGLLILLAVLTFIGSGWSFISYLILSALGPRIQEYPMPFSTPETEEVFQRMAEVAQWKYFLLALIFACSVIGAVQMLRLKKIGFHIYTIAQILALVLVPYFTLGTFYPGIWSILVTFLFIGAYGYFYKRMS